MQKKRNSQETVSIVFSTEFFDLCHIYPTFPTTSTISTTWNRILALSTSSLETHSCNSQRYSLEGLEKLQSPSPEILLLPSFTHLQGSSKICWSRVPTSTKRLNRKFTAPQLRFVDYAQIFPLGRLRRRCSSNAVYFGLV